MSCEAPTIEELAAQPLRLAVQPSGILPARPRVFPQHLLGTSHGVLGKNLGEQGLAKPKESGGTSKGRKLDLLVALDFRMSTTCVCLRTSCCRRRPGTRTTSTPRHAPFIHPLGAAVDPIWESRTDWEI